MRRLDAWLRPVGFRSGTWLRANKPKAALVWVALIVLSGMARVLIDGIGGHVVSYVSLVLSILLLMAYFQGDRA